MQKLLIAAILLSSPSYAFICSLGTCTEQCTQPDSVIGTQPLPKVPDISNGNYVDCIGVCRDLKRMYGCEDGTPQPWINGGGDNLDKPELATVLVYATNTFKVYAEPGFTPLDRELIRDAMKIVEEQLGVLFLTDPIHSGFGKCTASLDYERYSMADFWGLNFWDTNTYGHAGVWRKLREPSWPYIPGFPKIKYDLRIVKVWQDRILGRAYLGDAANARPVIALNWNNIKGYGKDRSGNIVRVVAYSQPGFWAGTIAHEILHTIGATHPEVNYENSASVEDYKKTFMVAFADCVSKESMAEEYDENSKLFTIE